MSLDMHPTALLWRDHSRRGVAKHDHVLVEFTEWPGDAIPGVVLPDELIYLPGIRQCEITVLRVPRAMTHAEMAAALAWLRGLAAATWAHWRRVP